MEEVFFQSKAQTFIQLLKKGIFYYKCSISCEKCKIRLLIFSLILHLNMTSLAILKSQQQIFFHKARLEHMSRQPKNNIFNHYESKPLKKDHILPLIQVIIAFRLLKYFIRQPRNSGTANAQSPLYNPCSRLFNINFWMFLATIKPKLYQKRQNNIYNARKSQTACLLCWTAKPAQLWQQPLSG